MPHRATRRLSTGNEEGNTQYVAKEATQPLKENLREPQEKAPKPRKIKMLGACNLNSRHQTWGKSMKQARKHAEQSKTGGKTANNYGTLFRLLFLVALAK